MLVTFHQHITNRKIAIASEDIVALVPQGSIESQLAPPTMIVIRNGKGWVVEETVDEVLALLPPCVGGATPDCFKDDDQPLRWP